MFYFITLDHYVGHMQIGCAILCTKMRVTVIIAYYNNNKFKMYNIFCLYFK